MSSEPRPDSEVPRYLPHTVHHRFPHIGLLDGAPNILRGHARLIVLHANFLSLHINGDRSDSLESCQDPLHIHGSERAHQSRLGHGYSFHHVLLRKKAAIDIGAGERALSFWLRQAKAHERSPHGFLNAVSSTGPLSMSSLTRNSLTVFPACRVTVRNGYMMPETSR